jgi:hypothetical protein
MTEYRGDEILGLIIGILNKSISNVGYPPYNYEVFLKMETEQALKELSFRLMRIRDISKSAKTGFHFYFSTELEYMNFLIESELVEYLNVFLILKKGKTTMPPLYDEHDLFGKNKIFSAREIYKMNPFRRWLKACQNKKPKPIRTVTR